MRHENPPRRSLFVVQTTGQRSRVGKAKDMELDPSGGAWVAICEGHGAIVNVPTRADAVTSAMDPTNFCDDCREGLPPMEERRENPAKPKAPKDEWSALGLRKPKPMTAEKLAVLLPKFRKGADAGLTMPMLIGVVESFGWRVEPIVMVVPRDDYAVDKEPGKTHDQLHLSGSIGRERVEARQRKLKEEALPGRPTYLEPGKEAIYDVSKVTCHPPDKYNPEERCFFTYFAVVGVVGLRFTDSRGRSFEIAPPRPSRFSASQEEKPVTAISPYGITPWLRKESSWFDDINAYLGTEPHVAGAVRTRDGTGTCWFCWRNIKLDDSGQKMVHHGYTRPGIGEIVGDCEGVHEAPYEMKVHPGQIAWKMKLARVDLCHKRLASLMAGEVLSITVSLRRGNIVTQPSGQPGRGRREEIVGRDTIVHLGNDAWATAIENEIRGWEHNLAYAQADAKLYEHAVATWKVRPLPTNSSWEGEHYTRLLREIKRI